MPLAVFSLMSTMKHLHMMVWSCCQFIHNDEPSFPYIILLPALSPFPPSADEEGGASLSTGGI